jgi:hypothetical protein
VTKVYYFTACALNNAAHDVDGSVMPVKQTSCCDDTNLINGGVGSANVHDCRLNQVAANLLAEGHKVSNNYRELSVSRGLTSSVRPQVSDALSANLNPLSVNGQTNAERIG